MSNYCRKWISLAFIRSDLYSLWQLLLLICITDFLKESKLSRNDDIFMRKDAIGIYKNQDRMKLSKFRNNYLVKSVTKYEYKPKNTKFEGKAAIRLNSLAIIINYFKEIINDLINIVVKGHTFILNDLISRYLYSRKLSSFGSVLR